VTGDYLATSFQNLKFYEAKLWSLQYRYAYCLTYSISLMSLILNHAGPWELHM